MGYWRSGSATEYVEHEVGISSGLRMCTTPGRHVHYTTSSRSNPSGYARDGRRSLCKLSNSFLFRIVWVDK